MSEKYAQELLRERNRARIEAEIAMKYKSIQDKINISEEKDKKLSLDSINFQKMDPLYRINEQLNAGMYDSQSTSLMQ